MRDVCSYIDDVVVQLDHLIKASADRCERCLHILERDFHLFACLLSVIPGMLTSRPADKVSCTCGIRRQSNERPISGSDDRYMYTEKGAAAVRDPRRAVKCAWSEA